MLLISLYNVAYKLVRSGLINFHDGQYRADDKLCELLEHLEEDNQQPSLERNLSEGSTTRSESKGTFTYDSTSMSAEH